MLQNIVLGLAGLLGVLILILAGQNTSPEDVHLLGTTLHLPLAVSVLVSWSAGLLGSLAVWQHKIKTIKSDQNLQKWEVQDAKLAAEITSDKEKQLQAKIDTLEAALRKVKDKNKA